MSRDDNNRDYIKRTNFPKQTYALSGADWGNASVGRTNGKLIIDNSPFLITPVPPGALGYSNESWKQTFGASMDAFLSLFDGQSLALEIQNASSLVPSNVVYKDTLFHAQNSNLYSSVNNKQQIHYVVSKEDVDVARASEAFGTVSEARSIALRGPAHMAGWGKTVALRPTDPNPTFRDNDNTHKLDRTTWKHGPIDLRWDSQKGCWRGWNDLIADHNGANIGTFVFGTNPDFTDGFPYIRGKLEDVWWVRKTYQWQSSDTVLAKSNDISQTGEILTDIYHRLFDSTNNGAGSLRDIFHINVSNGPGTSYTLGTETTRDSLLTLSIDAHFCNPLDETMSGPVFFSEEPFNADTQILGDMVWTGTFWRPAIDVNGCALLGSEIAVLYENDVDVSNTLDDLIFDLNDFEDETVFQIEDTQDVINDLVFRINGVLASSVAAAIRGAVNELYEFVHTNVQEALDELKDNVQVELESVIFQIVQSLAENCDCSIPSPDVNLQGVTMSAGQLSPIDISELDFYTFEPIGDLIGKPTWNVYNPCNGEESNYPR